MKFEPLDERPDARCLAHGAAADIWLLRCVRYIGVSLDTEFTFPIRAPAGASLRKIQAEVRPSI